MKHCGWFLLGLNSKHLLKLRRGWITITNIASVWLYRRHTHSTQAHVRSVAHTQALLRHAFVLIGPSASNGRVIESVNMFQKRRKYAHACKASSKAVLSKFLMAGRWQFFQRVEGQGAEGARTRWGRCFAGARWTRPQKHFVQNQLSLWRIYLTNWRPNVDPHYQKLCRPSTARI